MEVAIFSERKKSKSRVCCAVRECQSKASKNLNVIFHKFPKAGGHLVSIENFFGNFEKVDRLKAWQKLLRINKVTPQMKVCSLHFKKTDYLFPDYDSGKKFLKKNAVPSCNLPKSLVAKNPVKDESRLQRRLVRRKGVELTVTQNTKPDQSDIEINGSKNNPDTGTGTSAVHSGVPETSSSAQKEISTQVETSSFTITVMNLLTSENDFSTATGIQSYKIFNTIVRRVESVYGEDLLNFKLTLRERIILTYVKLKQNLSWAFLAVIFKKCTAAQCRHIFYTTLDMLFKCLKILIRWPPKEEISRNLPECFKDFEHTRVVVDCTEIFILAPSKLCCQELPSSNHKNSTTCKIMTGITPGGLISYFTKPYGGRLLDTELFEQSDLIKLLEPGDAVMTDRGFFIDELCTRNNWKLIRPPLIKDQKQLSRCEAILASKIAEARVYVQRFNQQIKAFALVGGTMSAELVPVLHEIFTVVCATVNLSSPIVNDDKSMKN
ncbi:uncharacterized protein LOC130675695 [Microplitis mediator]|uniref:uncharacterized protein LOC130675695 n=1 Tax=Microplitis mediator TaxID=375433 RepID=UPI0025570FD6|nr:uncharacterized protein LOC130675695 [Microplitis mediator]